MPLWTPAEITTALWLDGNDATTITLDGNNKVERWESKSGDGLYLNQATETRRPLHTADGPDFNIPTESCCLSVSSSPNIRSIIYVTKWTNKTGDYREIAGCWGGAEQSINRLFSPTNTAAAIRNGATFLNGTSIAPLSLERYTDRHILEIDTSDNLAFYDTGSGCGFATRAFYGVHSEIIASSTPWDNETRQKLEGYLAWKWGLESSLPVDHPYKAAAPTTGGGSILFSSLLQPYSLWPDGMQIISEQPYCIAADLDGIALEQLYSLTMEVWLSQHYGNVPLLGASLIQPYGNAPLLTKILEQRWGHAAELDTSLVQFWSMPDALQAVSEQSYGIVAEVLQAVSEQLYQINANSTLFADLVQPYALAGEAARLYQFDTRLYINSERIPFHTLEWQATDTEYAWSCDFAVKDLAVAQKCVDGAAITITSAGDTWQLKCYGGWFLDKRHASEIYRVSGYSRTKDLDLALPLLGDLPGGMASELVADLAAPFGISVDWQMADGYLAAGKITAGDETPREVIRKIVEDAGGIVQSTPEGNLLIVAEEEIPVPDWPNVVPADTIIARLERISTSEQRDEQRGYNRFLVSDQLASGDGFRWDEVSIDGSTKEVRLFVTPLDPARLFVLGHSGGSEVSIEPFGIRSLAVRDEQVEFVAGAGKTTKPIYSLTGYSWQKANLGAVSYAEDGLLTAAVSAYSLLKISYQTKFFRWIVRDRNIEDVQFIFHEVTP